MVLFYMERRIENKLYRKKYDTTAINSHGYYPKHIDIDIYKDRFKGCKGLINVEWGESQSTADNTKYIGTYGMAFCIALAASVDTPKKRHRFVSHMYPLDENVAENMNAFSEFLNGIKQINEIKTTISSTKSFTKRFFEDYEMIVLDSLKNTFGPETKIPLLRSYKLGITPGGKFLKDDRFPPAIITL